jgi:hypothetical protein
LKQPTILNSLSLLSPLTRTTYPARISDRSTAIHTGGDSSSPPLPLASRTSSERCSADRLIGPSAHFGLPAFHVFLPRPSFFSPSYPTSLILIRSPSSRYDTLSRSTCPSHVRRQVGTPHSDGLDIRPPLSPPHPDSPPPTLQAMRRGTLPPFLAVDNAFNPDAEASCTNDNSTPRLPCDHPVHAHLQCPTTEIGGGEDMVDAEGWNKDGSIERMRTFTDPPTPRSHPNIITAWNTNTSGRIGRRQRPRTTHR